MFPEINWNYRVSAKGNWSCSCMWWTTSTSSATSSRAKLSEQNRDLREARIKSLHEMEELQRVQELRIDEFSRRRLIEDRDTILQLTAKIPELQNEVKLYEWFERFSRCWISTQWTFPRYQSTCVFPTFSRSWRNAKPFYGNANAATIGRQAFGTRMENQETFS